MATYTAQQLNMSAPSGGFQTGGWYSGRQYWNGTFGEVGQIHQGSNQQGAGQQVSQDVVAQTNQSNVDYLKQEQVKAQSIQAPISTPTTSPSAVSQNVAGLSAEVEVARKALEQNLARQKAEADAKAAALRQTEQNTLDKIGEVSQPFRQELEASERERLYINQNFEENQKLVNELDQLLTEGNNLIKQQQEVTGLAAVRNPRIQKTMNDVASRAGVIQAVMNARNGQISQAYNMIDRTINAIAADKNDQLNYYNTILQLNRQDLLSLDEQSRQIAQQQTSLLAADLEQAQATANYVKELMINPASASLMASAGVSLSDSIDTINSKLSQAQYVQSVRDMTNAMSMDGYTPVYNPDSVTGQVVSITDSAGKVHYFKAPSASGSGWSANDFLMNELNKAGTKITNDGVTFATLPQQEYDMFMMEAMAELQPQVSPSAGIGTIYVDDFGQSWQYQSNGWILIG